MVALIVVAGLLTYWSIARHTRAQEANSLAMLGGQQARSVASQMDLYRAILVQLARSVEVRDLAVLGDADSANAWARRARLLLPGAVGLALVSGSGEVLGSPQEQRVGPNCLADLARIARGSQVPGPPVHRDNPALAHFDLVTPVLDDGGTARGLLFASFSLESFAGRLRALDDHDTRLEIRDAAGDLVTAVGAAELPGNARDGAVFMVPGTDWGVTVYGSGAASRAAARDIAITAAAVSVAVVLAVALLVTYITRLVVAEFGTVQEMLERIGESEEGESPPQPRLKETAQLMHAIGGLTHEIHSQHRHLETMSLTDELTGLANRRRFSDALREGYGLAQRGRSVCLALVDVDGFKEINDRYGHQAGDRCLQFIARQLADNVRRSDLAARVGGDEFALVLYGLERDDARRVLDKLLASIREAFATNDLATLTGGIALSIGLACIAPGSDESESTVLHRADEALYASKRAGGNGIEVA